MDVNGISNYKNNFKVKLSEDNALKKSKKGSVPAHEKQINLSNKVNSRVETIMNEMRGIQNTVSEHQSYLNSLHTAKGKLTSTKNIQQIFDDMQAIRTKARFNKKPLMDSIIPAKKDFFRNSGDLQKLKNEISAEITKTKKEIGKSQQQLSRFTISLENIRASLNSRDIKDMQAMFSQSMLYKNFNKELVISLML